MKNRNWIIAVTAVLTFPLLAFAERPGPLPGEHKVVEKNAEQHMEELNRNDMNEHRTYLKMYKEVIKDGIISQREAKQLEAQRDKIKGTKRS